MTKMVRRLVAGTAAATFMIYVLTLEDPTPRATGVQPAGGTASNHAARNAVSPALAPMKTRPTLKRGMQGPVTRMLQTRLNDLVWNVCFNHKDSDGTSGESCADQYRVVVDGEFGRQTEEAVILFQRQQRLVADGIVGPKTWAALDDPARPCDMPREAALALGATEREANFIAYIAWQESRCHLHQVVDRPSTRDYSWGPYGVNYAGALSARSATYGPPYVNVLSWRRATANVLKMGRGSGWCHWMKTASQFYCAGPLYQAGDPPPAVDAP